MVNTGCYFFSKHVYFQDVSKKLILTPLKLLWNIGGAKRSAPCPLGQLGTVERLLGMCADLVSADQIGLTVEDYGPAGPGPVPRAGASPATTEAERPSRSFSGQGSRVLHPALMELETTPSVCPGKAPFFISAPRAGKERAYA